MSEKELAQALFQAGLLTEEQIRNAAQQRTPESGFIEIIIRNGWVTAEQVASVSGGDGSADAGAAGINTPGAPAGSDTPWSTAPPAASVPPSASVPYTAPPPPYAAPNAPPIPAPTGFSSGAQAQGAMPISPRPGVISTDAISEAWAILKPNIGVWLGAIIVVAIIGGIFSGMQTAATPKQANGQPQIGLIWAIFTFVGFVLNQFLNAGLMRMAIENVRTGRAEIGEVFNVGDVMGKVLLAALLTSIAVMVGLVLCIIPGIIVALGLSMTNLLIVDQKLDAVEAMQRSWEVMKSRLGALIVLGIVLFLLNIVGFLACCVGILVTASLTQLTLAVVYRDLYYGTSPVPLQNPQ